MKMMLKVANSVNQDNIKTLLVNTVTIDLVLYKKKRENNNENCEYVDKLLLFFIMSYGDVISLLTLLWNNFYFSNDSSHFIFAYTYYYYFLRFYSL